VLEAVEEMGGILSLLLLLCMVFSGSVLARQQARDSVLARQQARDSVLARQQERDSVLARQQERDSVLARQQERDSVLARQQERDSVLARQQERDSVLARQQEQDSVARRMLDPWRLVFCQEALWVDDDAQPTDIPRREWKGKSSVAEVNSRCTKQEEAGTVKARSAKGISFSKGDWQQFPNAPPILPFNASDERQSGAANQLDPVHLASFSLTNFQGEEGRISGYLLLEITTSNNVKHNRFHGFHNFSNDEAFQNGFHRFYNFSNDEAFQNGFHQFYNFSNDEAFQSQRGYSALKIDLEGLMHETKEDITLCMLGCTMLPSSLDSASLLEEDCNVMFQMQYPKKLSLTRSVIRAQVTSLLNAGEKHHFHPINVTVLPPINRMPPYDYTVTDVIDEICSNARAETLAMEEDSFPGFALRRLFHYDFSVGFDVQPSLDCSPYMPNQWMTVRIFPFFSSTYLFASSVTWNWSNLTIKILLANVVCN
jgi:hypothetical protein